MIIRVNNNKNRLSAELKKRKYFYNYLIITLFIIGSFGAGYIYHRSGNSLKLVYGFFTSPLSTAENYITSLLYSDPERIIIDIKYKNYQKLASKRNEAIKMGSLRESEDDWVPAKIRYKNEIYNIKMRLKGDLEDHWKNDTWSFKIEVKDGKTLFGMKRFAIQHPRTREYLNEWIFHKLLRYSGLIGLRYDFIEVTINGKAQPIYAVEENFDKLLIENNNLREGLIFKFNSGYLIHNVRQGLLPMFRGSEIVPYGNNRIKKDPILASQFSKAVSLIELFRQNKLKTSQVFDSERLALYFAIIDLIGNTHASILDNIKFYYNPITSLIEPIGYDNALILPKDNISGYSIGGAGKHLDLNLNKNKYTNDWFETLFKDPKFFNDYIMAIEKITDDGYLTDFFNSTDNEYSDKLDILHLSYPWYSFNGKEVLLNNKEFIKRFLNPVKSLQIYYDKLSESENELKLNIMNIHSLPAEILGLSIEDSVFIPLNEQSNILQAASEEGLMEYSSYSFKLPVNTVSSGDFLSQIELVYKIFGTDKYRKEKINDWQLPSNSFITNDFIRQMPNYNEFAFIKREEASKMIIIESGSWDINKNIVFPKGYKVVCNKGTSLNLLDSAIILSYSAFYFMGTEEEPIDIHSANSDGKGIVLLDAEEESLFEHVFFSNLTNPSFEGWSITGAVTFYNSDVTISDCQFISTHSEDALNIVRSNFKIDNTKFLNTESDAFDSDFSKGMIRNTTFMDIGNDAIDISGTTLSMENIYIYNPGDKGVSAGEKSIVNGTNIKVCGGELAIASKDLSKVVIKGIDINSVKVGFTVYQKKPEYGPSILTASNVNMENIKVPFLVEEKSSIIIDGETIEPNMDKVKNILYGVEYGKSSR